MNLSNVSSPIMSALDDMTDCLPNQSILGSNCVRGDGEMLFVSNPEEILDAGRANPGEFDMNASCVMKIRTENFKLSVGKII